MSTARHRFPAASPALALLLALAACGGDAESAQDADSERVALPAYPAPAEPVDGDAAEAPAATVVEPADPTPPVGETAAAPAPQERPGVRARTEPPERPDPSRPHPVDPSLFEPAAPPAAPAAFVAAGTRLEATVETQLSTERSGVGDRMRAAIREDVLGADGLVLLPAGAVLNGRVVESRESAGADDPAVLRVEIESVTIAERTLPLAATVETLEVEADARDSRGVTATKVTAGAAAGAVIGRILGRDREGAIKGAVAGAAAGTAVALATRDGHAVVKPGALLVVRLSERLVVEH